MITVTVRNVLASLLAGVSVSQTESRKGMGPIQDGKRQVLVFLFVLDEECAVCLVVLPYVND